MIKIAEGELLDLLPSSLKNDTDMICLSYALKTAINNMIEYELGSMTQNFIDYAPEAILDVLAVELRSLYYLDSMDIETKRAIIKNTLIWHTKAGTASAVAEMIEAIFGDGYLVEWFDFDDEDAEAGTFDIVSEGQYTTEVIANMEAVIDRVKNVRSHLREILIKRALESAEYAGMNGTSYPWVTVANNTETTTSAARLSYIAAAAVSKPYINVE